MADGTYVAAIDQGTTSSRCMIFGRQGNVVAVDQKEHSQIYPRPGWVEHNPEEIWQCTQQVMQGALDRSGLRRDQIASIGISNQRETTVVWDRRTGKPIHNAIVWQDTRTDEIINELARQGGQDRFRPQTGLPLATYFSGPKVRWILEKVADKAYIASAIYPLGESVLFEDYYAYNILKSINENDIFPLTFKSF